MHICKERYKRSMFVSVHGRECISNVVLSMHRSLQALSFTLNALSLYIYIYIYIYIFIFLLIVFKIRPIFACIFRLAERCNSS